MDNVKVFFRKLGLLKLFVALIFVATSCNDKDFQAPPLQFVGQRGSISVGVSTANASSDDVVEKARVIVFNAAGLMVSNEESTVTPAEDNTYIVNALVTRGENHIYIICNETPEMGKAFAKMAFMKEIEKLTYSDYSLAAPLSMFAKVPDVSVTIDADKKAWAVVGGGAPTNTISATVIRTMSKLSLTVIKNLPADATKFAVEELSYKVCRMPRYSYLVGDKTYPQGAGWRPEVKVTDPTGGRLAIDKDGEYTLVDGRYTVPAGVDFITMPSIYSPEHLPFEKENPDFCTYLLVEAKCGLEGSSMLMNINYKLDIGNNPPVDNTLKRNTHYNIFATIKNLGAMGFYAEIVPEDQIDIPVNWKPFEGYVIVSEKTSEYGNNFNIWNDYSQYTGTLKVAKNKVFSDVLFRYGSIVALSDGATVSDFDPATDLAWKPRVTDAINSWSGVGYIVSGDVPESGENRLIDVKLGKGDPCRLVGLTDDEIEAGITDNDLWRMPTAEEMSWINTARNDEVDPRGFSSFSDYMLTQNSGFRSADGKMVPKVNGGYYWSATNHTSFSFSSLLNTGVATSADPQNAYAVRCIRRDIHPSRFVAHTPITTIYSGTTNQNSYFADSYNTPYWKVSVSPTDGFTLLRNKGSNKEPMTFTIAQLPNVYAARDYLLTATGYGLDGVVHRVNVAIHQERLVHRVRVFLKSPLDLPVVGGYQRLPAEGIDLSFGMTITPDAIYPPYNATFPTSLWMAQCHYFNNEAHSVVGTQALPNALSTVKIPRNDYPHPIAVEVDVLAPTFPPFHQYDSADSHKVVFIQEKF